MSLKWDDIDNRQLKLKQQAKELKLFQLQQNEETKQRYKTVSRQEANGKEQGA
jgi:hypothetical protein